MTRKKIGTERAQRPSPTASEPQQVEEALRASERQLSLILDTVPDLIWLKDAEGVYLNCNPPFERFFGASKTEIIGKTDFDFVDADLAASFRKHDLEAMQLGHPNKNEEWITFADGGQRVLLETTKTPMKNEDGSVIGVLGIGHDITTRHQAENTIRKLAMTDALTGLANRTQFEQRLSQSIELAKRENKQLALMMLDLDRFKPVNDSYGHPVGDAVLQSVAAILTKLTRSTDVVARFGGDEFAILVVHPDSAGPEAINAQRIIDEIKKPTRIMDCDILIGASIGIAMYPNDADDLTELIQKADQALYAAKAQGRGKYVYFSPEQIP